MKYESRQIGKTLKLKKKLEDYIKEHGLRAGEEDALLSYEEQPDVIKLAMIQLKKLKFKTK